MHEKFQVDMLKGNIVKTILIFAIPIALSNIFQVFYNMVDTMIVGHYLGDASLAAIGCCAAIFELMVGFGQGVGGGFCIIVGQKYGAHDEDGLRKAVAWSIVVGLIITAIITLTAHFGLYPLLQLLNTPQEIIAEAYSYINIIGSFVIVMFLYNTLSGVLRAIGDGVMPLVFLIISSVLNIILDIVFITKFNMGISGAAIATVIAQAVSSILCIIYIGAKVQELVPNKESYSFDKQLLYDLTSQGLAMGFMSAIVSCGSVVLQSAINGLGTNLIAGHTAARKVFMVCMMPLAALGVSLSTFVSQNKGAKQINRIKEGVKKANLMAIAWGVIVTIVMIFAATPLTKAISGSSTPEVIEAGHIYIICSAPFYTVLGMLLNTRFSLQAMGQKILPILSSVIELVGKLVFTWIVIPRTGFMGVVFTEPIIWCFMCLELLIAFYTNKEIKACK